jgi:sulfite reductase alpha subunit-like flavoprotein
MTRARPAASFRSALRVQNKAVDPCVKLTLIQAACSGGRDAYDAIMKGGGAFVDVLRLAASCRWARQHSMRMSQGDVSCRPSLSCIVACLPALQPRYYSACSSPLKHRDTM